MEARPSVLGWCPSVRAVLDRDWWRGKFIYKASTFTIKGNEVTRPVALCPWCGKWVPVHDGDMVGHNLPGGSDANRLAKMEDAKEAYGRLAVRDLMRSKPADLANQRPLARVS